MFFRRGAKADAARTPTFFTIPQDLRPAKPAIGPAPGGRKPQDVAFIGLTDLMTVRSSGRRHTTAVMAPERAGATRKKSSRSGEGQRHLTDRDGIHLVRWVGSETV